MRATPNRAVRAEQARSGDGGALLVPQVDAGRCTRANSVYGRGMHDMTDRMMRAGGTGLALLAALALSACGGMVPQSPRSTRPAPAPTTQRPPVAKPPQPQPPQQQQQRNAPAAQANGVIGADARALIRLFGEPRLDVQDPAVRKLQFSNDRCILDAYLYAFRDRREPVVTFAEARRRDGTAMDWNACASQLRGR
jgi:hypothetical protein